MMPSLSYSRSLIKSQYLKDTSLTKLPEIASTIFSIPLYCIVSLQDLLQSDAVEMLQILCHTISVVDFFSLAITFPVCVTEDRLRSICSIVELTTQLWGKNIYSFAFVFLSSKNVNYKRTVL